MAIVTKHQDWNKLRSQPVFSAGVPANALSTSRKALHQVVRLWLNFAGNDGNWNKENGIVLRGLLVKRCRMHIYYSGRVQGVGFRYTTKNVAAGFEVTGRVRNLPDGRVELVAEGSREELEAFQQDIRDSGLGRFITNEQVTWEEANGEFRGFEITS